MISLDGDLNIYVNGSLGNIKRWSPRTKFNQKWFEINKQISTREAQRTGSLFSRIDGCIHQLLIDLGWQSTISNTISSGFSTHNPVAVLEVLTLPAPPVLPARTARPLEPPEPPEPPKPPEPPILLQPAPYRSIFSWQLKGFVDRTGGLTDQFLFLWLNPIEISLDLSIYYIWIYNSDIILHFVCCNYSPQCFFSF